MLHHGLSSAVRHAIRQNRFLLAFMLVASTAGLGVGTAQIAVSLYAVQLHATEVQLGMVAAAQSIGILLMGIPTGILINRLGPLVLFGTGSLLAGFWYGLIPWGGYLWVNPVWFLIGCVMLVSFCMPLRFISLNTVFMSQLNQLGAVKAGWFRGTHMIGYLLLGPIAAVWLTVNLSFNAAFLIIGLMFTVPVLLSPLVFQGYQVAGKQAPALSIKAVAQQLSLFKRDSTLRFTSLFELFDSAVMGYFSFFIVVIAIRNYEFSPASAASLVTVYGSVYMAALFGMGVLVQRLTEKHAYQLGFALVAAALVCLSLPLSPVWLWIGSPLLGLGLGILNVVNLSVFVRIGQRLGMANVSAVSMTCGPSGNLLGCLLGGWLAHFFGLQAMFVPLALLFGLLVVLVQFRHPFISRVQQGSLISTDSVRSPDTPPSADGLIP